MASATHDINELKRRMQGAIASLKQELGSADFARVRVGVGRPPTTDPERVAAYVLSRFAVRLR